MACKLIIQSSDGVELSKLKIKNPQFAPLVGDCIQIEPDVEYKVLRRCFYYVEDGDVRVVVRCERVAATNHREVDD
ncbi:hypothetical protein [Lacipirellula sp.]|uniref:hypothetical protein n=1 Tax=Lacipirellula sp. TaxID=2691419 RepID=UPI003D10A0BA